MQVYETKRPATLVLTESGGIIQCPTKYYTQKQCTAAEGYDFLVEKVWPWLDAIIYSFLPFVIIIVLNSRIISRVISARRKRCRMTTQAPSSSLNRNDVVKLQPSQMLQVQEEKSPRTAQNSFLTKNHDNSCCGGGRHEIWKRDRQIGTQQFQTPTGSGNRREASETNFMLSLMLLTISFAFLLMTLPMNIMLIINNILNTSKVSTSFSGDHRLWAQYQLASTITELLMYLNHSTNFFLYCATGQKFRIELKRMLSGWKTHSSCKRLCCPKSCCSGSEGHRQRDRHLEWSIQNHNVMTTHDKSQMNQTIIMNIVTGTGA